VKESSTFLQRTVLSVLSGDQAVLVLATYRTTFRHRCRRLLARFRGLLDSEGGFHFSISKTDQRARAALSTPHGTSKTIFMPVGTQATVKGLRNEALEELGAKLFSLILSSLSTPGMSCRPRWRIAQIYVLEPRDSYGLRRLQVFSLSGLRKITDEGVRFRSHLDGSEHLLTRKKQQRYSSRSVPILRCARRVY